MKRAGCQHVQYGIESGSDRILRLLQKDISRDQIREAVALTRAAGLVVSIYLISGVPDETEEDIQATVDLIREILPARRHRRPARRSTPARGCTRSPSGSSASATRCGSRTRATRSSCARTPRRWRHFETLVRELEATGRRAAYRPADFDRFEATRLGFTFTGALQRSEWHRARGELSAALAAAEEIVRREPRNPWGRSASPSCTPRRATARRRSAPGRVPRSWSRACGFECRAHARRARRRSPMRCPCAARSRMGSRGSVVSWARPDDRELSLAAAPAIDRRLYRSLRVVGAS